MSKGSPRMMIIIFLVLDIIYSATETVSDHDNALQGHDFCYTNRFNFFLL